MNLATYRILRWVREEEERIKASNESTLKCIILDMTGMLFMNFFWLVLSQLCNNVVANVFLCVLLTVLHLLLSCDSHRH